MHGKFCFAIDRGGTFTDIFALCPNKKIRLLKLLSVDPANYSDAPREGIRRIITQETGRDILPDAAIPTGDLDWIRMGTTVATNALLERKGERIALLITEGFRDLLHIGNQARPSIFSLEIVCPEHLYEEVIEIEERLVLQQNSCELKKNCPRQAGTTGEIVEIWKPLNEKRVKNELLKLQKKGIQSLAVVLMHSYLFPMHEKKIKDIALGMGFKHVSLSSEVMPMLRIVPRGHTACVDAYLTPCIKKYVENFSSGFQNKLKGVNVLFMQSDGGLTPMDLFYGSRAVLSGPAGGVIGYSKTAYKNFSKQPIIGFDMGGTSTDVSRFDGHFEHVYDTAIAGVNIQSPQLDIQTVAAGGGSMLFFRSGLLVVGPESAGAHPGPVCYRKGGPLTVTDANLVLGRLYPEFFPKIFGKTKDLPLDKEAAVKAFEKLKDEINDFIMSQSSEEGNHPYNLHELALGFVTVANEAMSRPIRALTQGKGFDTSQHILAVFGGAGSQHACSIAKNLGISTIFIHKYAGILSAFGMALANVVSEAQESSSVIFTSENFSYINSRLEELSKTCIHKLKMQGFKEDQISVELYLNMRYDKTDCALMCTRSSSSDQITGFLDSFLERYKREFGFSLPDRPVRVDDIRARGLAKHSFDLLPNKRTSDTPPKHRTVEKCYFHGAFVDTKIFLIEDLFHSHKIPGPAIIIDSNCTILVEPDCLASMTEDGNIIIKVSKSENLKIGTELDMIHLSIFSHRFMSIAEQMGKVLQRTAISTNIKERLDFSCALFGPDGGLVSNAPHIPVHLGSMQEAVKFQIQHLGESIRDGDVILSNHPLAGGTHLPDLTVMTPVFYKKRSEPVFFVASRGHHADIGGLTPGSMPAHSTCLAHEGAAFLSFKLVENGIFQEEAVTELLQDSSKAPGCTGTRNLQDNLSDLKAQVAANKKGISLVLELIEQYSLEVVQCYMAYIQKNADIAVRHMLKKIGRAALEKTASSTLISSDYMDDGTPIQLKVDIDTGTGCAIFDFKGTGYEVYGNCNAPKAICFSAIIYCLRCMVEHDIPLNQGCLSPIQVIIPEGSILSPSKEAAVVGGNVLTSQRIVDVIFKAFKTCAASQGCMNNITFGDENMGYYETVAGGSGAAVVARTILSYADYAGEKEGSHFDGRSGIHTHMTNTRITDPEVLEKRYPVVLELFHLKEGTGGRGQYKGGDGVLRKFLFRKDITLSVLTERRVFAPYGLEGGEDGEKGSNLLMRKNGRIINLGAKNSVEVSPGDAFLLQTPGGGGYGAAKDIL